MCFAAAVAFDGAGAVTIVVIGVVLLFLLFMTNEHQTWSLFFFDSNSFLSLPITLQSSLVFFIF
jgi:hypothetical protein